MGAGDGSARDSDSLGGKEVIRQMVAHEGGGWTHAICRPCWNQRRPGEKPIKVRSSGRAVCFFCGAETAEGIYVRHDPKSAELDCRKK